MTRPEFLAFLLLLIFHHRHGSEATGSRIGDRSQGAG
jgi:hypothetical protein